MGSPAEASLGEHCERDNTEPKRRPNTACACPQSTYTRGHYTRVHRPRPVVVIGHYANPIERAHDLVKIQPLPAVGRRPDLGGQGQVGIHRIECRPQLLHQRREIRLLRRVGGSLPVKVRSVVVVADAKGGQSLNEIRPCRPRLLAIVGKAVAPLPPIEITIFTPRASAACTSLRVIRKVTGRIQRSVRVRPHERVCNVSHCASSPHSFKLATSYIHSHETVKEILH